MIQSKKHQSTLREDAYVVDISAASTARLNGSQVISLEKNKSKVAAEEHSFQGEEIYSKRVFIKQ